jgi:uncharacterized protein (TIGR03086 family)
VRLHADGVDHRVRPPAVGQLAHERPDAAQLLGLVQVDRAGAVGLDACPSLGHRVDAEHPQPLVDTHPRGHVADRAGAEHQQRAALGDVGVPQRLPRGRQHVGEEQEPVVRGAVRHLDRREVRERHPEVLRLTAGDVPVELAVAEEAGAGAVLVVLRGLALAVELAVAHPAGAAGDVERDDDAVTDLQLRDGAADLLDDPHRLVADDVTGLHERRQRLVEMQVRAAQPGRGDLDDRVGRLLDPGVGHLGHLHVVRALPGDCLHVAFPFGRRIGTNVVPMSPSENHRSHAAAFTARVDGVPAGGWDAPAPVEGWLARDVVRHLVEWFPGFLHAGTGIRLPGGPSVDEDPAGAWAAQRDAVQALLDDPASSQRVLENRHLGAVPLPEAIDRFYTADVFMHTWDLARATGQDETLDADTCRLLYEGMLPLDDVLRASGQYGPKVPVPADSDPQTLLLAFIGRRP